MATIKSFTDINQSRKLAEILPVESADMCYRIVAYNPNDTHVYQPYCFVSTLESDMPCWSLAALFNLLPSVITRNGKRMFLTLEKAGAYNLYYKSPDRLDELWETKEDAIDACYEMILKLHEQKLL